MFQSYYFIKLNIFLKDLTKFKDNYKLLQVNMDI